MSTSVTKYYGGVPEKTLLDCDVRLNHAVTIIPAAFICLNVWCYLKAEKENWK